MGDLPSLLYSTEKGAISGRQKAPEFPLDLLPTSVPMCEWRMATNMACSMASLSLSRDGVTHDFMRTSVREEFISVSMCV